MHARNSVRSVEKSLTLADSPYTVLPYIYNVIKVNTAGGNVRVNLPTVDYPIDVIKTSSDAYIVTIWVGGTQIGEVAGELSVVTIENAEVTQDEPWYPYDVIVGIAGVSGDGGEVLAKDRFGRVIAGGRGVAGTDDAAIYQEGINTLTSGGRIVSIGSLGFSSKITVPAGEICISGMGRDSYIRLKDNSDCDMFYANELAGVSFENLYLYGNRANQSTGSIIHFAGSSALNYANTIKGCSIVSAKESGIYVTGGQTFNILDNYIDLCDQYAINSAAAQSVYLGNQIETGTLAGMYIGGSTNQIIGGHINSTIGMIVNGHRNIISGLSFTKLNAAAGVAIQINADKLRNIISNCLIYMSGVTSRGIVFNGYYGLITDCVIEGESTNHLGTGISISTGNIVSGGQIFECNVGVVPGISSILENIFFYGNTLAIANTRNNVIISKCNIGDSNTSTITNSGVGVMISHNMGHLTESSGSSTGTGSEQAIPHGLDAIPVGCKAWIKIEYPIGSGRYITKDIPFDATNVYPTVDNGVAFEWGIA